MPNITPIESQELSFIEKLEKRPFWKRLLLSYRDLLQSYGELQSMYEELKYETDKDYISRGKFFEKVNALNKTIQKQATVKGGQISKEKHLERINNLNEVIKDRENARLQSKAENHVLRERVNIFENILSNYDNDFRDKIRDTEGKELYCLFGYDKSKWNQ